MEAGGLTVNQNKCLFIGDLAYFCNENDLKDLFSEVGIVEAVEIKRSKQDGSFLGYGFVTMQRYEDAVLAINTLDKKILCGRPIKVRWGQHGLHESAMNTNQVANSVYVKFRATQSNVMVNEEILAKIFSHFGKVVDASIKSSSKNDRSNIHHGYGFVHFEESNEGAMAAQQCSKALADSIVDNIRIKCELSHNFVKRTSGVDASSINNNPNRFRNRGGAPDYSINRAMSRSPVSYPEVSYFSQWEYPSNNVMPNYYPHVNEMVMNVPMRTVGRNGPSFSMPPNQPYYYPTYSRNSPVGNHSPPMFYVMPEQSLPVMNVGDYSLAKKDMLGSGPLAMNKPLELSTYENSY